MKTNRFFLSAACVSDWMFPGIAPDCYVRAIRADGALVPTFRRDDAARFATEAEALTARDTLSDTHPALVVSVCGYPSRYAYAGESN